MELNKKNLANLDFSNYHIDPRSSFMDSNLENCNFANAKFGFDFDHQVDFTYSFLVGTRFPKEGTTNRASGKMQLSEQKCQIYIHGSSVIGVEIKTDGAILSDHVEDMFI